MLKFNQAIPHGRHIQYRYIKHYAYQADRAVFEKSQKHKM